MKNARPLLVILSSIIVGVIAVVIAAQWVVRQGGIATTKVVVAARDLEVGTRLRADLLQLVDWPAGAPLKEPFADPQKLYERVVNTQVLRGEPIVATKLAALGEKGGLSAVLQEGKRAITVKVNEIVGVAGFALPGNFVDVMVNTSDDANRSTSKIVLERILVLAVAQDLSANESKPRVVSAVTLEVTPQQAEQIDLARSIGSLSLVLRSQGDKTTTETTGARKNDLLKMDPGAAHAQPATQAQAKEVAAPRPVVKPKVAPDRKAAPPAAPASAPAPFEVIRGVKKTLE